MYYVMLALSMVVLFTLMRVGRYWLRTHALSGISEGKLFILWMVISFGSIALALSIGMVPMLVSQYKEGMPFSQIALIYGLTQGIIIIPGLMLNILIYYFYPSKYIAYLRKPPTYWPFL